MKTQMQLCREAQHNAVLRMYADFIRGMESKRTELIQRQRASNDADLLDEILQLEAAIDRQMRIFASM